MSLTIVKYRKTTPTPGIIINNNKNQIVQQIIKKPILRLDNNQSLILNNIPAIIKPSMKRIGNNNSSTMETLPKTTKYTAQTNSTQSNNNLQWQQALNAKQQQQIGAAINSLPPSTIIKSTQRTYTNSNNSNISTTSTTAATPAAATHTPVTQASNVTASRPATVFLKREAPKRYLRSMTLNMIEDNPLLHLGITTERLAILKRTINTAANVTDMDCYITLKKLRQNEAFAVLADYFELSQSEVELIFIQTLARLARYLRYLIRWPAPKQHNERRKYMPFAYRANLFHIQSMIECVETDVDSKLNLDCCSYKFIYCINTNNVISFISEAYRGDCDDLMLFEACDFKAHIPKYLTLMAEPGKGMRRQSKSQTSNKSDANNANFSNKISNLSKYDAQRIAGELASAQTMHVVDGKLTSNCVKNLSIPTVRICDNVCRDQIRYMIDKLREFKILQPYAIQEPMIFEYLNEILIVTAALTNLQH